jgi:hypothetical protein
MMRIGIVRVGEVYFEDLGEWLEPERDDGRPRAYKPWTVLTMEDRSSFISRCRPLEETVLNSLESIESPSRTSDK